MRTRRIVRAVAYVAVGVLLDLLEAVAYFATVALVTVVLGLLLPFAAAFVVALVGVSVCFGYHRALRMERARMRGES